VAVALVVPACVALTWWQVARALAGNTLSWVYSFEWPIFAAYALYMWWKLLHDDPASQTDGPKSVAVEATPGAPLPASHGAPRGPRHRLRLGLRVRARPGLGADGRTGDRTDAEARAEGRAGEERAQEDELAAYNRYLAELNASGKKKRW
jgi:hypothetical protein